MLSILRYRYVSTARAAFMEGGPREYHPMTSHFSQIVDFVAAHPHYALTAVFLLALSEAIPAGSEGPPAAN